MSGGEQGGTGTYKVTEGYLQGLADQHINAFLEDLKTNHAVQMLRGFAGDTTAGGATFDRIYAGSGKGVTSAALLQDRFAQFSSQLKTQLDNFNVGMTKLYFDLGKVDLALKGGEDSASDISKTAFDTVTKDALSQFGGSAPGGSGSTSAI
ncbi:hypothetical protein ABWJ92_20815 [Streptomyces sp. NPDC000609]|uniref:hypothetical protein n=1 Tax=Streptomyces sp. NPDC000609 TaxID=3160957 RepID=UPI0033929FB8